MIYILRGSTESMSNLGNSLRTCYISSGRGALLVRETEKGELPRLLEKIIAADKWSDKNNDVDKIKWKRDPVIILLGSKQQMLLEFEKACPGFTNKFGPLYAIDISEPSLEEKQDA